MRARLVPFCGSAAIGIWSAGSNALQGNWGAAAIDVAGVGADVAAIATPGVPGGAGFAIQGTRRGAQALNAAGDARSAGNAVDAAGRAKDLAGNLSDRTRRSTTIAVTETAEGTRVISSSEGAVRPAVRDAMQPGEVAVSGRRGTHAEINGINGAESMGLTPTGTAASRPICSGCASEMRDRGVEPLSPLKDER